MNTLLIIIICLNALLVFGVLIFLYFLSLAIARMTITFNQLLGHVLGEGDRQRGAMRPLIEILDKFRNILSRLVDVQAEPLRKARAEHNEKLRQQTAEENFKDWELLQENLKILEIPKQEFMPPDCGPADELPLKTISDIAANTVNPQQEWKIGM